MFRFLLFIVSETLTVALSAGFIMLVILIALPHPEMPVFALVTTMMMIGAAAFLPISLGAILTIAGSAKGLRARSRLASVLALLGVAALVHYYTQPPITLFTTAFAVSLGIVVLASWEFLSRALLTR